MYFTDNSSYIYGIEKSLPNVLNIGWLDRSKSFPAGPVPQLFLDNLKFWFSVGRANQMRGIHQCNICRENEWPLPPLAENPSIELDGHRHFLGSSEIWLPTGDGGIFASPSLIIHYVEEHNYSPPPEFISAVMNIDRAIQWNGDTEYQKRVTRSLYIG